MKKRIVIGISLFLVLQFVKIMIMQDYKEAYGISRIEYTIPYEGAINYESIKRSDNYKTYLPVMLKRKIVSVAKLGKSAAAIGTNAEYMQLEHLSMVEGSFIVDSAVEDRRNVAVISDQAAITLYGSAKVVGRTVQCNGIPYKIVGVYKKYRWPYEYAADDGYEHIYIPITVDEMKEIPLQEVIINGAYIEKMPNQVERGRLGLGDAQLQVNDYTHWVQETKAISQYPIIAGGVILCIIMGKRIANYIKKQQIWKQIDNKDEWLMMGRTIGSDLLFAVIGLIIIYYSSSKLYVQSDRLPSENIFDIAFYWKQLCNDWIRYNLYRMESISQFGQLLQGLERGLHGINCLQYFLLLIIFSGFGDKIKE